MNKPNYSLNVVKKILTYRNTFKRSNLMTIDFITGVIELEEFELPLSNGLHW